MQRRGDLRHKENYALGVNLTPEQEQWSDSWSFIRDCQQARLNNCPQYLFAGLVLKSPAVLVDEQLVSAKDAQFLAICMSHANRFDLYHTEDRPVRLHTELLSFGRDLGGRAVCGGACRRVFAADAAKHPSQDHEHMWVVDFDPSRGEVKRTHCPTLFGQNLPTKPKESELRAPFAGKLTYDQERAPGWMFLLIDGAPAFRIPAELDQLESVADNGSHVEAGDLLSRLTGNDEVVYYETSYVDDMPADTDDHRVFSPLDGELDVVVDDVYANLYLQHGRNRSLLARFHADDVSSGHVILASSGPVTGAGHVMRTADNRIRHRKLPVSESSEAPTPIATLVAPVSYALVEFWSETEPKWLRASARADYFPVSRDWATLPLRLVGQLLDTASRYATAQPGSASYPAFPAVGDHWPKPMAVFSSEARNVLGLDAGFCHTEALQQAICLAVSPSGDLDRKFPYTGSWRFLQECSADERQPNHKTVYYAQLDDEGNPTGKEEVVRLPASAVLYQRTAEDREPVMHGTPIADWLPREFYAWEDLVDVLGNNVQWITNEYLKDAAYRLQDGRWLLPDELIQSALTDESELYLMLGHDNVIHDGVVVLSPIERTNWEMFTWQVNDVEFDATPEDLLPAGGTSKPAAGKAGAKKKRPNRQMPVRTAAAV